MTPPTDPIVGLGARSDFLATAPNANPDRLALSADERVVFALVGRASTIAEVLTKSGWPEAKTIAALLGLRAKGAVVPARMLQKPTSGPVSAAFNEEVDLDDERKSEILRLEKLVDGGTHYEILGADPRATADELRNAYHEASRRFHPDRFFQKNLGSFRARVERIFRRMSEAHSALSDPDKRKAYDKAHPELFPVAPEPEHAEELPGRADERRARLARHPYLFKGNRARELQTGAKSAADKGEHSKAVSMLNQAAGLDPKNRDLQSQLTDARKQADMARVKEDIERGDALEREGNLEAAANQYRIAANVDLRNPEAAYKAGLTILKAGGDLKEAKGFAQRAADLQPKNPEYHMLLGRVLLQADMKRLAKREFEEVVKLAPDHPEAKAQLKKMKWTF